MDFAHLADQLNQKARGDLAFDLDFCNHISIRGDCKKDQRDFKGPKRP